MVCADENRGANGRRKKSNVQFAILGGKAGHCRRSSAVVHSVLPLLAESEVPVLRVVNRSGTFSNPRTSAAALSLGGAGHRAQRQTRLLCESGKSVTATHILLGKQKVSTSSATLSKSLFLSSALYCTSVFEFSMDTETSTVPSAVVVGDGAPDRREEKSKFSETGAVPLRYVACGVLGIQEVSVCSRRLAMQVYGKQAQRGGA